MKFEVSDEKSQAVFVIFDNNMSYILEKSCVELVAAAKVGGFYFSYS